MIASDVYLLIEDPSGSVEVVPHRTRLDAVAALQAAMEAPSDARQLTILENGRPVCARRRTPSGWRDDPIG